jgi:hypothetical protein
MPKLWQTVVEQYVDKRNPRFYASLTERSADTLRTLAARRAAEMTSSAAGKPESRI